MDSYLTALAEQDARSTISTIGAGLIAASILVASFQGPREPASTVSPPAAQRFASDSFQVTQSFEARSEREEWEIYLLSLTAPTGSFSARQVNTLRRILGQASEQLGVECPVPITQPTVEGYLQVAWDNGRQYIDAELTTEGQFHWYFRDREKNEVIGTNDRSIDNLGADFFHKLATVVKAEG